MQPKYKPNDHVIFKHRDKLYHGVITKIEEEVDGHKWEVYDYNYYIESTCSISWINQNKIIGYFINETEFEIIKDKECRKLLYKQKKELMDQRINIDESIKSINKELEKLNNKKIKFRVYDIENKCYLKQRDCFINGFGQFIYRDSQGMLNNWTTDYRIEFEGEEE